MEAEGVRGDQVHLLVFELSGQRYGVDVEQVLAVVEGEPSAVGGAEGQWSYQGQDVPLRSLARWIGLDQVADAGGVAPSRVLLSDDDGVLRGFVVDTPQDIVTLSLDQIFPVPDFIRRVLGASPLWGVGRLAGELMLLIDLAGAGPGSSQGAKEEE